MSSNDPIIPVIYVTRYALTEGIQRYENAEHCVGTNPGMVRVRGAGPLPLFLHGEGKDWHRTPESALKRAEQMRQAKIASLKKQLAKLEKLTFDVPEKKD